MQWFFYTRLDRGIDAVGRFKEAFVNVSQLTRELQDQIETMRTRGAPADERGRAVWEILTESHRILDRNEGPEVSRRDGRSGAPRSN
jgi:hypothetical protein